MSAQLENVRARLRGVVRNGQGFMALCPVHEDRNQSLSVKDGEKAVLIKCHAGCSTESVLTKLDLTIGDLFFAVPESGDGNAGDQRQPKIVAAYPYVDDNGELLYQVVRYEPKDFRQRKPDGKGGWTWKLGDVRRVLYRLPEVLASGDVLVLEGEKDVETARGLGVTATCNAGGAGKWKPEYSESLHGKRVAIIADADEPGRKHAQGVAASLFGKVASLKVLELPGAKDLSEHVDRGGNRESLTELIGKDKEWEPTKARKEVPQGGFRLTALRDLMSEPEEHTAPNPRPRK